MKNIHLGKIVDITPDQATCENRIVLLLNKHKGGVRQSQLFRLTGACRVGKDVFARSLERLAVEDILVRHFSTGEKSFLLKLTPWGEQCAEELQDTIEGRAN